jgi:hypothetical protein
LPTTAMAPTPLALPTQLRAALSADPPSTFVITLSCVLVPPILVPPTPLNLWVLLVTTTTIALPPALVLWSVDKKFALVWMYTVLVSVGMVFWRKTSNVMMATMFLEIAATIACSKLLLFYAEPLLETDVTL